MKETGGPEITKTLHGRVRGKTIELDEDLRVVLSQEVEVQMKIVEPASKVGRRYP